MRRFKRPGTIGGFSGSGSFNPATGYGHSGHTGWEDDTAVHESLHFFKGHEIAVTERLRLIHDGKAIRYTHEAKGPKGDPVLNEVDFEVGYAARGRASVDLCGDDRETGRLGSWLKGGKYARKPWGRGKHILPPWAKESFWILQSFDGLGVA